MTEALAPGDVRPATRGEFLAARETAMRELERRIGSRHELLVNCALVSGSVFALMMAGSALSDARVETFHVVFTVIVTAAAIATVPVVTRRALRTRTLMAALLAWETAELQARSLAPGHVRPDLRMPFDARQDADFEDVALTAEITAEFRPSAMWLIVRAIPAGVGLLVGSLLVIAGFTDLPVAVSITWGVAGGYLLVSCLVTITGMFRMAWRLRKVWQVRRAEIQAWRSERIGPVAAAEVQRAAGWQRARIAAPFVVISVLALVARLQTSSPEVVAIAVPLVVLTGLVVSIAFVIRWYRRRAATPAEQDLTSVPPG